MNCMLAGPRRPIELPSVLCLQVGEAAGVRDEALCTVDRLRMRLRRVAGEAAVAAAAAPSRPRVLVLQSLRPLRTVGWWAPDQLTLAGGACGLEEMSGDAPQELTWEQVRRAAVHRWRVLAAPAMT